MCVSIFSTTFVGNISHFNKNLARYYHKCENVTFCRILIKLDFSQHISEESLKYQISSISVQWEPSCSMRTDGWMSVTKLKVAFRNFAKAPKNKLFFINKVLSD
jgi:hypothetical protein